MIFYIQSSPQGVPPFVTANTAKVDLPSLRAALPKYGSSGLGPITIQWWSAFIEFLQSNMTEERACSSTWLFTELDVVELKKTARPCITEQRTLPQQLLNMRDHESEAIPEVCMKFCMHQLLIVKLTCMLSSSWFMHVILFKHYTYPWNRFMWEVEENRKKETRLQLLSDVGRQEPVTDTDTTRARGQVGRTGKKTATQRDDLIQYRHRQHEKSCFRDDLIQYKHRQHEESCFRDDLIQYRHCQHK